MTAPPEFRKGLYQLGRYLAYELSKELPIEKKMVESPFGKAEYIDVGSDLIILGILRAALPMAEGVFEEFPEARIGFLSASRGAMRGLQGKDFDIQDSYTKIPKCENKHVLIIDPMLASASTLIKTIEKIQVEKPTSIRVVSAIGTEYGIKRIEEKYPAIKIYIGVIDPVLNEKGYIIPGLGDAGDRAFNTEH
jgi:uracil phosphoribosyltransferase